MPAEPRDLILYNKIKKKVYKKIPKHSAYRSGILVQQYKKAFKKKYPKKNPYKGKTTERKGLKRWFNEKWVNQDGKVGYHSKSDIYRPSKRITSNTPITHKELSKKEINEDLVSDHLSFNDVSDLDLIIRTSGETRLSNFMLWESAYSEIYFTETLWPSFEEQEFMEIIQNYSNSERRFGSVTDQIDLKKA